MAPYTCTSEIGDYRLLSFDTDGCFSAYDELHSMQAMPHQEEVTPELGVHLYA